MVTSPFVAEAPARSSQVRHGKASDLFIDMFIHYYNFRHLNKTVNALSIVII